MKKLDIGSGRPKLDGYITLDKDPSVGADIVMDFENFNKQEPKNVTGLVLGETDTEFLCSSGMFEKIKKEGDFKKEKRKKDERFMITMLKNESDILSERFHYDYNPIFDEIRAHHILEHFKPENKVKVLSLCWDLLKDGGILDIEIPLFPHPASVQDPTHISFWTVESFKYFIKGDPFGEAFAKRYSEYPVPLFEKGKEWYKGDNKPYWAYGLQLIKKI